MQQFIIIGTKSKLAFLGGAKEKNRTRRKNTKPEILEKRRVQVLLPQKLICKKTYIFLVLSKTVK